jgi:hypothetical protein
MKKEYNIKDKVWIHLGEPKMVEGRVVEIIDLAHLNENHSPDRELYVIELKTGIDDIYEVRPFDQISPDAKGPIMAYRNLKEDLAGANRYLKKVGIKLPHFTNTDNPVDFPDELAEPTAEQIHAAMERAEKDKFFSPTSVKKPRKRPFVKRKKIDTP